jgi:anti-anti-sigma factor
MGTVPDMTGSENQLVITSTADGLAVTGEIDVHTAPDLAAAMADADRPSLTVDLSQVSFIDSSGLRVLIEGHRRALESGATLRLTNPSDTVRRLLDISGLDDYLDVD